MLARVVEFSPSSDAAAQFTKVVEVTALGIVAAQAGCAAAFVRTHGDIVLGISIWTSTAAAERYSRECYPGIEKMLRPFLTRDPKVYTFDSRELESGRFPARAVASKTLDFLRYVQADI